MWVSADSGYGYRFLPVAGCGRGARILARGYGFMKLISARILLVAILRRDCVSEPVTGIPFHIFNQTESKQSPC